MSNARQRFDARVERVEAATMDLIQTAHTFNDLEPSSDQRKYKRRSLLEAARRYVRALNNLARNGRK